MRLQIGKAELLPLLLATLTMVAVLGFGPAQAFAAPASKVDVCHSISNGSFIHINVSENAFEAHVGHGDVSPGEGVPGMVGYEFDAGCATVLSDADDDGIADINDNCPGVANSDQVDLDSDGSGDVCDPDADGDTFEGPLGDSADCDDLNTDINPDASDVADDGIDQDCDGFDAVSDGLCRSANAAIAVTAQLNPNGSWIVSDSRVHVTDLIPFNTTSVTVKAESPLCVRSVSSTLGAFCVGHLAGSQYPAAPELTMQIQCSQFPTATLYIEVWEP